MKEHIESSGWGSTNQHEDYYLNRSNLSVSYHLQDLMTCGDAQIMWTPGHSPDEICVLLDDFLFTGDHVLPEITPHPTIKSFPARTFPGTPPVCLTAGNAYGLGIYLTSLGRVIQLGEKYNVMPAHRLYNKGDFNFTGVERALEIVLTTLHSGGKFNDSVYKTSGGLHGVGISVVNALSSILRVKVFKGGKVYSQKYSQ